MSPDRDEALVELARELPWQRPDAARRESMRAELLASAELATPRAPSRARWIVGGAALAAAAAIAVIVTRGGGAQVAAPRAEVIAVGASDYDHVAEVSPAGATQDVVRLRAGRLRVATPAPVRVEAGSGEVDVERGAAIEVAVDGGVIAEVAVERGKAEVKVKGEPRPIFLSAGETWKPTIVTASIATTAPVAAPVAVAVAPVVAPPTPPAAPKAVAKAIPRSTNTNTNTTPTGAATPTGSMTAVEASTTPPVAEAKAQVEAKPPSEAEQDFTTGWSLLRAGHFADAAAHFGAAVDADPSSPLADDARYFEAVALARAGRAGDAEHVLTDFLAHAPRSLRRGRASVMLGWLYAQRGERDAARARFADAASDPDDAIAASARAGLAALDRP